MVYEITRSSGRMQDTDGVPRKFADKLYTMTTTAYCREFASADDLLAWVQELGGRSVVLTYSPDDGVAVDGGSVPQWTLEIYDSFRE